MQFSHIFFNRTQKKWWDRSENALPCHPLVQMSSQRRETTCNRVHRRWCCVLTLTLSLTCRFYYFVLMWWLSTLAMTQSCEKQTAKLQILTLCVRDTKCVTTHCCWHSVSSTRAQTVNLKAKASSAVFQNEYNYVSHSFFVSNNCFLEDKRSVKDVYKVFVFSQHISVNFLVQR